MKKSTEDNIQKEEFSIATFSSFINKLSRQIPDMKTRDWKSLLRDEFKFLPEQESSLTTLEPEFSNEVQNYFGQIEEHLKSGGGIDGKIVENPDKTHTIFIFLQKKGGFSIMLKIACGDANCRNWHWGNHPACKVKTEPIKPPTT
jgi:hypothetical protein